MSDPLIRRFCESPRRWLIVAIVTALLAVAAVLPTVDLYLINRASRSDLTLRLQAARQTAEQLPDFEKRAAQLKEELRELEDRTVEEDNLARFRSQLVDAARESGCQIRRLEVGTATRRPWKERDQPLAESPAAGRATPFFLERRNVVLAVDGTMPAIHDLLARLEKERTMSHPHRLMMQPANGTVETVTLEIELWLFALSRTAA
jgi:hypothetical protein